MGAITKHRINVDGVPTPIRPTIPTGAAGEDLVNHVEAGNILPLVAASAALTNGADQINGGQRGVRLIVDVTAISGVGATLVVSIKGKDPVSGKYQLLLASAGLTAVGTYVLTVYPGLTAVANAVANDVVPRTYRAEAAISGTTPLVSATVSAIQLN